DSVNLTTATVTLTNYVNGEDVLSFVNTVNISGSFDAITGVLTLTGVDSVANYEAALQAVMYHNTSETPDEKTRSVTFVVNDGVDDSNIATSTITINAVNDAPVNTFLGAQSVAEDDILTISGISVTDVDGNLSSTRLQVTNGVLTISLSGSATISSGANGSNDLTISGNEADINATLTSLSYQGNLHFNGNDTLSITSTDSDGTPLTDVDTVDITVTAVNDVPTTADNTVTTNEDTEYIFGLADFGFADIDGDSLASVQITSLPSAGQLTLNNANVAANDVITALDISSGNLKFVPQTNGNGLPYTNFGFSVNDGTSDSISSYTLTVDVTAVNDAPITSAVTLAAIAEDSGVRVITEAELLANASDIDGDTLSVSALVISSGLGGLTDNGDGTWNYIPAADDESSVSFSYTIDDGNGGSVAGSATLDITPVNDEAPLAVIVTPTAESANTPVGIMPVMGLNDFEKLNNFKDITQESTTAVTELDSDTLINAQIDQVILSQKVESLQNNLGDIADAGYQRSIDQVLIKETSNQRGQYNQNNQSDRSLSLDWLKRNIATIDSAYALADMMIELADINIELSDYEILIKTLTDSYLENELTLEKIVKTMVELIILAGDNNANVIVTEIVAESSIDLVVLQKVYDALKEQDTQKAKLFYDTVLKMRLHKLAIVDSVTTIDSASKSWLVSLKDKLMGRSESVVKGSTNAYSEEDVALHSYKVQLAKANLLKLAESTRNRGADHHNINL
ncbi:tandem-95 repeat protein, partial [Cysteiniphilum litorale]|uniref:tandem-95 repeat protein n=2 Tax=Cysteiniphilum litorale TaxID=2056700 RepID=UPI003F8836AF